MPNHTLFISASYSLNLGDRSKLLCLSQVAPATDHRARSGHLTLKRFLVRHYQAQECRGMYKLGIYLVLWQHKELQMQKKWVYRKHSGDNVWKESSKPWSLRDWGGWEEAGRGRKIESHLPGSQETLYFLHLIELHELLVSSKNNSLSSKSFFEETSDLRGYMV